jgi:hypothetical protein
MRKMEWKVDSRFSKANLVKRLWEEIEHLETAHRLDPNDGWAQLTRYKGEALIQKAVAYGRFRAYHDLLDEL